jgi:antitoxin component YwqK of YwqJK toxin-antitoxin module
MVRTILVLIVLCCFLLSCKKTELYLSEEEVENDIIYKENSLIPFEGTIILEKKYSKQINQKQNISDGKLNGESVVYYANGKPKVKGYYKNGQFEGLWEKWYAEGNRECIVKYSNGFMNGECTSWYENGKMKEKGFYANNIKIGRWIKYNNQGLILQEIKH